jgi:hypothetical protein
MVKNIAEKQAFDFDQVDRDEIVPIPDDVHIYLQKNRESKSFINLLPKTLNLLFFFCLFEVQEVL